MANPALRIVIADDEPITRMDLKEFLEERGYSVLGEATDGLSTARILQQEQIGATIVLLTAYSEREFIDSAKEIGVSGYLVKPIDEKSITVH